jgi:hypothetical protein
MFSCNATKMNTGSTEALPPVIVYKTTGNYYNLVPITLNETKDQVVSYPAPSDLYTNGQLALPVKLENGYLFDQRGVNAHSVFTSFTYEEYSQMESAPSVSDLIKSITDPNPFEEIYNCGNINEFKNPEKDLNKLIRKRFKGCVSLMK